MPLRTTARMLVVAALALAAGAACAQGMGRMPMPKAEYGTSAVFAGDGTLIAVTKQGEHVMLYRSPDEGRTWSPPAVVNAVPEAISADGENRPKILALPDGALLATWTRPLGKPFSGAVRAARSEDGGATFSPPLTVHRDRREITHRFEAPVVDGAGRIFLAWIDKRDLESARTAGKGYRGAAVYAAVSDDGGRTFRPEVKVADHSCECCRIAAAPDTDGVPLILWRHVFEPNERDHSLARLGPGGAPSSVTRATFERWKIDACPHHGPALAVAPDGTRHAVWFNVKEGEGRVFYGRLTAHGVAGQRSVGGERAAHADLAVAGQRLAIAWKEFDGERTQLRAEISGDGGVSFRPLAVAQTAAASDQPRVIGRGDDLFVFWRTEGEGMRLFALR
ncbi:MAG: exo-alpha-sialidase [Betaproteobacteria bacterium]|nr:exo-alpha-sialidase [Betaproteobacteria bacterium]